MKVPVNSSFLSLKSLKNYLSVTNGSAANWTQVLFLLLWWYSARWHHQKVCYLSVEKVFFLSNNRAVSIKTRYCSWRFSPEHFLNIRPHLSLLYMWFNLEELPSNSARVENLSKVSFWQTYNSKNPNLGVSKSHKPNQPGSWREEHCFKKNLRVKLFDYIGNPMC